MYLQIRKWAWYVREETVMVTVIITQEFNM